MSATLPQPPEPAQPFARKTTIVSILAASVVLATARKIGVENEHEYLFEEVKRKIEVAK